ncbi:MAG: HAD family hydrolase [Candidatus Hydrothermarchaeota archaeon]
MIKLVVFDLDGVLVKEDSIWDTIHSRLGFKEECERYKQMFYSGKISYREWAELDVALWRDIPYSVIKRIADSVPYMKGAKETVNILRKNYQIGVISSGLTVLSERVKKELKLDFAIANQLIVENDRILGVKVNCGVFDKPLVLENIVKERDLRLEEIAAVGDHLNDIGLFEKVGLSVAFNTKREELIESADFHVPGDDLREILRFFR